MSTNYNRRRLLASLSAFGATGFVCAGYTAAEQAPETSSVRFVDFPGGGCVAPQYVAEGLLRGEGFSGFTYVPVDERGTAAAMITDGDADFGLDFASAVVVALDKGLPVKDLAGIHTGCYELFARDGIHSVLDLKGKRIGVGSGFGSDPHLFVSAMATYVGLDPQHDINWIVSETAPMQLFAEGKIDALLAVAQEVQEMRARKLGHVVVSGLFDRPWSQYFCCNLVAGADYIERYPIATKRVMRAILKGADACVSDPQSVARLITDKGHADNFEYTADMLSEIPYASWRELNPEDSLRFFGLRLREAGIVSKNPNDLIAAGTDWRFLNELKRELKT